MKVFFDHLQKTGGSTLNALFTRIAGAEGVTPVNLTDQFSTILVRYAKYPVIAGHVDFLPGDALPEDRLCMTLLRHPIERCLSWYSYNANDVVPFPGPRGEVVSLCRSMSLLECLRSKSPTLAPLSNYQTDHFARLEWDGASSITDDEKLAMAKSALERYDLVGVQEEFDEFVDVLCARMGVGQVEVTERLKAASRPVPWTELDSETMEALTRANLLDIDLHEHARALFARARRTSLRSLLATPLAQSRARKRTDPDERPELSGPAAAAPRAAPVAPDFGNRKVELISGEVHGHVSRSMDVICGELATLTLVLESREAVDDLTVGIHIFDEMGVLVYGDNTRLHLNKLQVEAGSRFRVLFTFRADLGEGAYVFGGSAHRAGSHMDECYHWTRRLGSFNVAGILGPFFEGRVRLYPQLAFSTDKGPPLEVHQVDADSFAATLAVQPALSDFRASIELNQKKSGSFELSRQSVASLNVKVENHGTESWPSTGERPVRLSYHWLAGDNTMHTFDGERTALPHDLAPGNKVTVAAAIRAPNEAGRYKLCVSLLQEAVAWFDEKGTAALELEVNVV